MSTRLIVSYEEAVALRDAGWNDYLAAYKAGELPGDCWFEAYIANMDDSLTGEPTLAWTSDLELGNDLAEVLAEAPHFEDLLAFLWERGYRPDIKENLEGDGSWTCWMPNDLDDGRGPDPLSAVVVAVLNVLPGPAVHAPAA